MVEDKAAVPEVALAQVLVVDDNAINAELISFLLTRHGYEVRVASDAEEALVILRGFRPHLILMDVQLPGMDGLALTRRLKADPQWRDTAIVALTAYAMKGDEQKARDAGCDGYVTKPVDTRSIADMVAGYIARSARRPQEA